jgi:leucyl aminopeptidase
MIPTSTDVSIKLSTSVPAGVDAIAAFVHKQTTINEISGALPAGAQAALRSLMTSKAVTGKSNEVTVQLLVDGGKKPQRLIVVGLGNREKFSAECLREGAGTLAKAARRHRLASVALVLPEMPAELPGVPDAAPAGRGRDVGVQAIVEGFVLASFDYEEYKGAVSKKKEKDSEKSRRAELTLLSADAAKLRDAVDRGRAIADGQNFARTIASRPGNDINPPSLAKVAQQMSREAGLTCRVVDDQQMTKLGMGGILAVGAGSRRVAPPRMIVMEWKGSGFRVQGSGKKVRQGSSQSPLLVVGKAITFDTGGISIKPADKMGRMIFDKCGGMAVLGLMYAVAKLKLPVHVVGILTSAENHISETAYRPGDILKMYNGVTVEVTNTDAEGRLVLGDALAWGIEQYEPSAVVDLATLTGGVIVALGHTMAGMMSNDDVLSDEIKRSADRAGEKVWRLPVGDAQREQMKSDRADIVNSAGRDGTPLQGAAFLSHFVPEKGTPWVHLDIAGVADTEREQPFYAKGATGWGVRTLVQWVMSRI